MKLVTLSMIFWSLLSPGISNEDATKFVDKYDSMSKRFLGLMNCISRNLTGDDALTGFEEDGGKTVLNLPPPATTMKGCFEQAGIKTGKGFDKLLTLFSGNQGEETPPSNLVGENFKSPNLEKKDDGAAANLIQRRPASEAPVVVPQTPKKDGPAPKTKW